MSFVSCITGITERMVCTKCNQVVDEEGTFHIVRVGDGKTPDKVCGELVPLEFRTL